MIQDIKRVRKEGGQEMETSFDLFFFSPFFFIFNHVYRKGFWVGDETL